MKKSGIKSSGGINYSEESNLTENIINTVREPLLVLNKELRVLNASRSFYDFFKSTRMKQLVNSSMIWETNNGIYLS